MSSEATSWLSVTPAKYTWTGRGGPLQLLVKCSSVQLHDGRATAHIQIASHGVRIEAVIEGTRRCAELYLGNYFIVPPPFRRCGLATACLLAMAEVFQRAAFGYALPEQELLLSGYFTGEGQPFALALCAGMMPTKAQPAGIDPDRLHAVQPDLRLDMPPSVALEE